MGDNRAILVRPSHNLPGPLPLSLSNNLKPSIEHWCVPLRNARTRMVRNLPGRLNGVPQCHSLPDSIQTVSESSLACEHHSLSDQPPKFSRNRGRTSFSLSLVPTMSASRMKGCNPTLFHTTLQLFQAFRPTVSHADLCRMHGRADCTVVITH